MARGAQGVDTPALSRTQDRDVVRAVRTAAAATLYEISKSTSLPVRTLSHTLRRLGRRGRCDEMLVAAATNLDPSLKGRAWASHPAPPPPLNRAVPAHYVHFPNVRLRGSAAWRRRDASDDGAHRLQMVVHAKEATGGTRARTAEHPNCPPLLLGHLATDPTTSVREATARNPRCPPEALLRLSRDWDDPIRQAAAANPGFPSRMLCRLFEEAASKHWMAVAVVSNTGCSDTLRDQLMDVSSSARMAVAASARCDDALMARFVGDTDPTVRAMLAGNAACRADLLDRLAQDSDTVVRKAVAENPRCPTSLLQRLAEDPDQAVKEAAKVCASA